MSRLECFFDRRAAASCIAIIAILVIICLAGCGGGGGGSSNPVSVNINFTSVSVPTSGAEQFSATVSGTTNNGVTWSIQEGSAGGSITPGGLYSAPSTPGTFHIIATSVADPTKSGVITVTVTRAVIITVAPQTVVVRQSATQAFTTTVQNTTNTAVQWSVQEGIAGGTITGAGLYTAPAAPGTYHVQVKREDFPEVSATATVTVK